MIGVNRLTYAYLIFRNTIHNVIYAYLNFMIGGNRLTCAYLIFRNAIKNVICAYLNFIIGTNKNFYAYFNIGAEVLQLLCAITQILYPATHAIHEGFKLRTIELLKIYRYRINRLV
jgi:hypothetical protein